MTIVRVQDVSVFVSVEVPVPDTPAENHGLSVDVLLSSSLRDVWLSSPSLDVVVTL